MIWGSSSAGEGCSSSAKVSVALRSSAFRIAICWCRICTLIASPRVVVQPSGDTNCSPQMRQPRQDGSNIPRSRASTIRAVLGGHIVPSFQRRAVRSDTLHSRAISLIEKPSKAGRKRDIGPDYYISEAT